MARDLDLMPTGELLHSFVAEEQKVTAAVQRLVPDLERAVELWCTALRAGGRIIYVGAGTSGRIGALEAAEWAPTFGVPTKVVHAVLAGGTRALLRAVEGAEDNASAGALAMARLSVGSHDVVVGLAASGETPFTVAALRAARFHGASTMSITVVANSTMAREAQLPLVAEVGSEILQGSTRLKAASAQKLILNACSTAAMVALGHVHGELMVDLKPTNAKLRRRAVMMVANLAGVSESEAQTALADAQGQVKTAVVMLRLGISRSAARRRLKSADGQLRRVLTQNDRPQ